MTVTLTECRELVEDEQDAILLHAILTGERDPREVESCDRWVRQCYHEPSLVEQQMEAANGLMDCHGVEAILSEGSWGDVLLSYVNTGDTYALTLAYDPDEGFLVTSWGDWVEVFEREHGRLP